jgi:protein phosphatase
LVFVGDTHGDVAASKAVVDRFGHGFRRVYLGDYVDRSVVPFGSLENLYLLLSQKLAAPDDVILLRGNHEFERIFNHYGFADEISAFDPGRKGVRAAVRSLFAQLPYAAHSENGLLCLHGGIPDVASAQEIADIPKGLVAYDMDPVASQIVWNDNVRDAKASLNEKGVWPSQRNGPIGHMFLYGNPYFEQKMALLGKRLLLRAHDYSVKGYSLDDHVLTIFTSDRFKAKGPLKGTYVALMSDPEALIASCRDLEIVQL